MTSQSPSRELPYRDSSPTSPLTPLSPNALPQWIRQNRPRSALFSNGRIKVMLIGVGCILMGWMLTSTLGPTDSDLADLDSAYDVASGGVLNNPDGFGSHPTASAKQPGILGDVELEEEIEIEEDIEHGKKPSVTGALSELHDAVKDKLQSWNPYFVKGSHEAAANASTKAKHKGHNTTTAILGGEDVREGLAEHEKLGARTRIGKCTILFHGNSYWERAIRTHERHDREHGYRLHVLRQELMDDVWSKPAYILSLLLRELGKPESERLDWLFWIDADTVLLNPYIPLDVFLPPPGSEFEDIHLVYSNDWNGLNNGVFPIRVNQWAVNLFAAIVSWRHYRPKEPLVFRDQSAMDSLMHEPAFAPHVVQAPQRWFNAYQGEHNETLAPFQIRRGDLLVHFAGVPDREARMNYWLERAEQHLDDWEVPVKSTSYPQEAKDFWNEQRQRRQQRKEELAAARLKGKELVTQLEQKLKDYGDRLAANLKEEIEKERGELNSLLDDENRNNDLKLIEEEISKLEEKASPLDSALSEANKSLLKSAHEAIFAGEKDLLESGFHDSGSSSNPTLTPYLQRISDTQPSAAAGVEPVMPSIGVGENN
ncbi:Alpha-1,2-galactosyltransferase [Pseudocercospora fuligena]|uniref:Alpha-1,2-galactosyltransferase n=1 Tax=Pseudocercospora fuligena TaxID=685502 RepID=A0A8H6RB33_9PEZI|nr:Alpha-1,2-galactosyltransferase [Pseudocercospora fuligena]